MQDGINSQTKKNQTKTPKKCLWDKKYSINKSFPICLPEWGQILPGLASPDS